MLFALVTAPACNQLFDLGPVVAGDGGQAPDDAQARDGAGPDDADSTADDGPPAIDATPVDGRLIDAPVTDAAAVDAAAVDAAPVDAPRDAAIATCGNGATEPGEMCDDGNQMTEFECLYGQMTCVSCSADCQQSLSLTGPYCGDGVVQQGLEECDGSTTMRAPCCQQCTVVLNCLQ
jgi:hypothetical protein